MVPKPSVKKQSKHRKSAKRYNTHAKREISVDLTPDKVSFGQSGLETEFNEAYIQRTHKDTLFRLVFRSKNSLLQLYNALNQSSYENPDDLVITTLENVIYLGYKNDISFLLDHILFLLEHQSSWNPNMPLRGILYYARLLSNYVDSNGYNLYGTKLIPLPVPRYIVFYNGTESRPEQEVLKLSDAFMIPERTTASSPLNPSVECQALVLNINYGKNSALMENCQPLMDYARFVSFVRENIAQGYKAENAVDLAVDRCLKEGVLSDVLKGHRREVVRMFLEEYDQELHYKTLKKEAYEEASEQINALYRLLIRQNRMDDVIRCTSDREFQKKLLKEYALELS